MTYAENQQLCVPLGGIALRIARNLLRLPLSHAPVRINGREASLVPKQISGHYKIQIQPLRLKPGQHPPAKKNILRTVNK
jgi:hypothetical protein